MDSPNKKFSELSKIFNSYINRKIKEEFSDDIDVSRDYLTKENDFSNGVIIKKTYTKNLTEIKPLHIFLDSLIDSLNSGEVTEQQMKDYVEI